MTQRLQINTHGTAWDEEESAWWMRRLKGRETRREIRVEPEQNAEFNANGSVSCDQIHDYNHNVWWYKAFQIQGDDWLKGDFKAQAATSFSCVVTQSLQLFQNLMVCNMVTANVTTEKSEERCSSHNLIESRGESHSSASNDWKSDTTFTPVL